MKFRALKIRRVLYKLPQSTIPINTILLTKKMKIEYQNQKTSFHVKSKKKKKNSVKIFESNTKQIVKFL